MKNPLLSVVIPCYNGEKYIKRCIESIIQQSYTNIEILIINDGSIDKTVEICKTMAEQDNRIHIISQRNQGSSCSRKNGINISKGEYITFVDVDDWIHPYMYEYMMKGLIKENADIAQCGVCDAILQSDNQIKLRHRLCDNISEYYNVYNKIDGVLKILDDKEWQSYMWNKIYKKNIFKNIQFPKDRFLDEDLSIMHQVFHQANLTIYFSSEFYYYLQGSVTQKKDKKNKAKKIIDRCDARWERFLFTKEHTEYHLMLNKMHNIFISVSLTGIRWAINNPDYFSPKDIDRLKERILKNPISVFKQMKEYFSISKKIEYLLLKYSPLIYRTTIKFLN